LFLLLIFEKITGTLIIDVFSESTMNFSMAVRVLGRASRCTASRAAPTIPPAYSIRLISLGAARLSDNIAATAQPEQTGHHCFYTKRSRV
jgi:hypothetical protein